MREKCSNCGNTYKNIHSHQKKCKSPKKPGKYVAGQEGSGSASDVNDMLDFAVVRRPRSSRNSRDAMTDMDDEEAIVLLQELCGKDKSSDDDLGKMSSLKKPAKNVAGQEEVSGSASDGKDMLDFAVVRRPRSSRNSRDEMNDMDAADSLVLLQELRGKDKSSDDESGVEHSGVESAADSPDVRAEFDAAIAVIDLLSLKPKRNSASADLNGGTEKCANLALSVEETELTRNDDGQRLVDCPESSAVMELKQPKPDLKVSDNSENPASDDGQGGINDASGLGMPKGKQTSLTEPMAREVDQEPKQKLDSPLPPKEQAAMVTTSVDEPGTDKPGEESGADKSDEVLTSCSEKSTCSVEYYGGGENTSDSKEAASAPLKLKRYISEKSGNEARVVEEEDLSRGHSHQALADCPENSAGTGLKKPKLDHKALDNSVVMQEEKQKIDLSAPAPSDSSEEERSDIIDGQANHTP